MNVGRCERKGVITRSFEEAIELSIQDGFVLKRSVFQPCLELYPMDEWNLMMEKINKLNRFVKKKTMILFAVLQQV
jgi:DNA-binding transcriptional regulator/RsmH inhibitor MraZ